MDDVPKSVIGQMMQDFDCFVMRKILYSEVGKYNSKGFEKILYELLSKIPMSYVYERIKAMIIRITKSDACCFPQWENCIKGSANCH